MKKILITGAKGFIGQRLVSHLEKSNQKMDLYLIDKKGGTDINDYKRITCVFDEFKPTHVIHLAAELSNRLFPNIRDNVCATKQIIRLCREYQVKKLIFSSSAAVYGNNCNALEIDHLLPINFYGMSKKYCEKLIKKSEVPYVILRLSNVFGRGGNGIISKLCEKSYPVITSPLHYSRDFVAAQDVCNAIAKSINSKVVNETFNISTGKETTLGQLDEMFTNATVNIKKKREISWSCLNSNKAKMLLKWQPKITLQEGIDDYGKL